MSRHIALATISSPDDLVEYYISDAEPIAPGATKGYSERCIHSEVMKRFPTVNAVVHSHSVAVVPYTINQVPFRAVYYMVGFLGCESPVWDMAEHTRPWDKVDLLVRIPSLGQSLAAGFASPAGELQHSVVLMRGHGFTVHGPSIQNVVLRAVYTQQNASIQTTALLTHAAYFAAHRKQSNANPSTEESDVHYLSSNDAQDSAGMTLQTAGRPWGLWLREVETAGLYVNRA